MRGDDILTGRPKVSYKGAKPQKIIALCLNGFCIRNLVMIYSVVFDLLCRNA